MRGHWIWLAAALVSLGCERAVEPASAPDPAAAAESPFPDACEGALETMGDDSAQAEELCYAGDLDPSAVGENDVAVIDACLQALQSALARLDRARGPCEEDADALAEIDVAQEMLADSVDTFELLRAAEDGDDGAAQRLLEKLLDEAEELEEPQDMGALSAPRAVHAPTSRPLASS